MAIIYGRAESEVELLRLYPKSVKKIEDIDPVHQDLLKQLKNDEENIKLLRNNKNQEKSLTKRFDNTIKSITFKIKKYEKTKEIKKFEKNDANPFNAGANGELKVLEVLSKLSDDYHVFCGLNISLNRWTTYNGRKNLRSAQMDFVVVSRKGIFLIEVKNWSNEYLKNDHNLSPHEQTDRAGRVLWIFLTSVINNLHVTNVLLPIHENIEYNQNYRGVFVSNLHQINNFFESRQDVLSDNDMKRVISVLKNYVTG